MIIIRLRFSSVVETTLLFENDDVIHKLYIKKYDFLFILFFWIRKIKKKIPLY